MRGINRLKHSVERFIIKGARYQLLLVAALIGLISVAGGALIRLGAADPTPVGESVWWAFLRLTDPGYLGDDSGILRRTVSTVITVLGYVLFMGSLVAILTQWLNTALRTLERGLTPIARNNHVVVLGWSERVGTVVRDLFHSEGRMKRFLRRQGARRLHVAVLSDDSGPALLEELRLRVGAERWNPGQVTLRSGSALRRDHLLRVDFRHAAAVILPAGNFAHDGAVAVDTYTIKALLSMSHDGTSSEQETLPLAVAEILDARKLRIAEAAYRGPVEVIASDTVIARLISQIVRHPGIAAVYTEFLTHSHGNKLYVRHLPELSGTKWFQVAGFFAQGIPLGVVQVINGKRVSQLNPPADLVLAKQDMVVVMAREYESTFPSRKRLSSNDTAPTTTAEHKKMPPLRRRILVLGWNQKLPELLQELSHFGAEQNDVHVVSSSAIVERESSIAQHLGDVRNISLSHSKLDYTIPANMEEINPSSYDTIIMLSSDWVASGEEADARTVVGYLLLQSVIATLDSPPHVIVEVRDSANDDLLEHKSSEVLISPEIISHMLAQIALRRDLNAVFDDIFASGSTEISFRPVSEYLGAETSTSFEALQERTAVIGDLALGYRRRGKEPQLNPRGAAIKLTTDDEVIVLERVTLDSAP